MVRILLRQLSVNTRSEVATAAWSAIASFAFAVILHTSMDLFEPRLDDSFHRGMFDVVWWKRTIIAGVTMWVISECVHLYFLALKHLRFRIDGDDENPT